MNFKRYCQSIEKDKKNELNLGREIFEVTTSETTIEKFVASDANI